MSKSALVMKTPKNCYECPFSCEWFGDPVYEACCELYSNLRTKEDALITEECYDYEGEVKPDWCPLKPLPEKNKALKVADGYELGYEDGWDKCLEKITEEVK